MKSYRLPTDMASYDVGIRYNTCIKEPLLSLHDNNNKNHQSIANLHLNKDGKCHYKIFFRNNTSLRCEILIFVNHFEIDDKYLGYPSNHIIVEPDNPHFIGKTNSLDKSYIFEQNYVIDENTLADLNSHIIVKVYPEATDRLWHDRFGFIRSGVHYTYKIKLLCCKEMINVGYSTVSK